MRKRSTATVLKTCLLALAAGLCAHSHAARPVPSAALLERLAAEDDVIGIVHWGLNTFTDREWGYGDEDPRMLDPKSFDADQIVGACKAGGMKGLVVVAKHHDGFCLWPTKTTEHNITKSPFRGGKGDYVREMADACRRAGLKFGVYVSPWDRNSSHYATEKYVDIFHAQIKELLGGAYGEVFEMWFDGANGGDGWYGGAKERRKIGIAGEYYRFGEVFRFVRELQPKVTIFAGENDASDFRWPGNERGILDPDSRATVVPTGGFGNGKYGNPAYKDEINKGSVDGTCFRMCEADFPLRKGWFYHEKNRGTTKSAAYLTRLYIGSVGNGGIMNIGVSPTKDGVLDADDVRELRGFGEMKAALFRQEVTEDGKPFNLVEMREDLRYGEQVDGWKIVADGREILSGKSIGYRRIRLLAEPVSPAKCTLEITASGPRVRPVKFRRYFVEPELAKKILSATGDTGETETAKRMSQAASVPALPPPGKDGNWIRSTIGPYIDRGEIAGIVSVISDPFGKVTADCFGWADVENRRPMSEDTVFAVFSMTKTFTGAAIMAAIDEGKISLDDKVSKYLPEFKNVKCAKGPLKRELTIRDITSHVSGGRGGVSVVGRDMSLRSVAKTFAASTLKEQPGDTFAYGNVWIDTAAAALEVAVGEPFEKWLDRKILAPLGMKDTTFFPNEDQISRLVKAYTTEGGPFRPAADNCAKQLVFPRKTKIYPCASGGLFSTPRDMIRFSRMLAGHGTFEGNTIISRRTFDGIFAVKQTPPGIKQQYTVGSWLEGDWFGHEGAMRTDQRANLKTGHARVFFIQTENKAGKAFFSAKRDWHAAADKMQGTVYPVK